MASIRKTKLEVTYLINEVISDCYMALYFQGESSKEAILKIINDAVELNNNLIERINHPADKQNASLVKKHYSHLRAEMFQRVDALFADLSVACKTK